MPRCSICMQDRRTLKFRTGRISICRHCVGSLNRTELSPRIAEAKWRLKFRESILRNRPDADSWVDDWLQRSGSWIVAERLANPVSVRSSHELKVLRAYRSGLICVNREYLNYPSNWDFKRFRVKHLDHETCNICGPTRSRGKELHVHHIVFRSNSGTNGYRNLVTLCHRHHQAQHDHEITSFGGEPPGPGTDSMVEELDTLHAEPVQDALPEKFSEAAYFAARPTFEAALQAFRKNNKSARELFAFLIETFGSNVGRYALKFAEEESLRRGC